MKCAPTLVWLQVKSGMEKTGTAVSLPKMKLLSVCHNGPSGKQPLCVKLAKVQLEMVSQVFGILEKWSLMWTDLIHTMLCQKTLQQSRANTNHYSLVEIPWKSEESPGKKRGSRLYFPVKTESQTFDQKAPDFSALSTHTSIQIIRNRGHRDGKSWNN